MTLTTSQIIVAAIPYAVQFLLAVGLGTWATYYMTEPYRRARRLRGNWIVRFFEEHDMPQVDEQLARRHAELRRAATRAAVHSKAPAILSRATS